jgi:hypothetical protein
MKEGDAPDAARPHTLPRPQPPLSVAGIRFRLLRKPAGPVSPRWRRWEYGGDGRAVVYKPRAPLDRLVKLRVMSEIHSFTQTEALSERRLLKDGSEIPKRQKRVVVTGGSGNLGRWVVREMCQHGWDTINCEFSAVERLTTSRYCTSPGFRGGRQGSLHQGRPRGLWTGHWWPV